MSLCSEEDEAGVPGVKQSAVPLFSQHLLTVEQLRDIVVDADIQASVNDFLKGLSTQMFARSVVAKILDRGSSGAELLGSLRNLLTLPLISVCRMKERGVGKGSSQGFTLWRREGSELS